MRHHDSVVAADQTKRVSESPYAFTDRAIKPTATALTYAYIGNGGDVPVNKTTTVTGRRCLSHGGIGAPFMKAPFPFALPKSIIGVARADGRP